MPGDRDSLGIWTVYDHPCDYPDLYVARLFTVGPGGVTTATAQIAASTDLDVLREALADRGLVKLDRFPEDDPATLETWL
jgi:hypothetical protein